jgi:hypothetical protein
MGSIPIYSAFNLFSLIIKKLGLCLTFFVISLLLSLDFHCNFGAGWMGQVKEEIYNSRYRIHIWSIDKHLYNNIIIGDDVSN